MFKYKTSHGNVTLNKDFRHIPEGLVSSREAMIAKVNYPNPPIWHYVWNKIYKTTVIKDNGIAFDANRKSGEDVAFNDDFLVVAKNVYFLDKYFYLYDCSNTSSLTRNKKFSEQAIPSYERTLDTYRNELQRYQRLIANSQRLGCFNECVGQLRKAFCMYLYRLDISARGCDYHEKLMQAIRLFDDYDEMAKYYPVVKRKYITDKAKGKLRKSAKALLKYVLRE